MLMKRDQSPSGVEDGDGGRRCRPSDRSDCPDNKVQSLTIPIARPYKQRVISLSFAQNNILTCFFGGKETGLTLDAPTRT